jgi:hypothetical protein
MHDVTLLQAPRLAEVRSALAMLEAKVAVLRRGAATAPAIVTFYFSGHSDGKVLELGGEALEFSEVKTSLARLRIDLQVVVLDACQSGSLLAMKGGAPAAGFPLLADGPSSEGLVMLTSTAGNEAALESSELGASYFSHHLVSGLRGAADLNRDGQVTLTEAYDYASTQTVAETAATVYGPQHPNYYLRLAGRNDLVLTRLARSGSSLEVPAGFDRLHIIEARSGLVAAELGADSIRRVALPAGPYVIKGWRKDQVRTARLTLGLGQARLVDEAELTAPRAPPADDPLLPPLPGEREPPPGDPVRGKDGCSYRCAIQANRTDCQAPVQAIEYTEQASTWQLDVPRHGELVLKFMVCDPRGFWLHVADSPTCDGGGGDATQFSNDAELEFRDQSLWVLPSDYGRTAENRIMPLGSSTGFVAARGCSERTVVLGDRRMQSKNPPLKVESDFLLRLDPARDDEGTPDRRWYLGVNRSVGSAAPGRAGSGLAWVQVCLR